MNYCYSFLPSVTLFVSDYWKRIVLIQINDLIDYY